MVADIRNLLHKVPEKVYGVQVERVVRIKHLKCDSPIRIYEKYSSYDSKIGAIENESERTAKSCWR